MTPATPTITLVLGGTRSGKSEIAERRALRQDGPIVYLATGTASDADMQARVDRHRERRGERFRTIEAGAKLVETLRDEVHDDEVVLIDSLGTWVAAHDDFAVEVSALVAALDRQAPTIIVSDEVGLGVHPSTELGNRFRDVLGSVNRAVADIADEVLFVVAGRVLPLDRFDDP